jgi:putative ABC transport system ATP-binding protein
MLIKTVNLVKSYERRGVKFFAADNINFEASEKDYICITGQSGSGKSTLLNIITGILKADGGEVFFEGVDLRAISDASRAKLRSGKIGCIPQGNSLLQNFSVLDNVCLPWYLSRRTDVRARARELLAKVGIAHLERESPRNLSGGEARRVAIARSLIADPLLLVADEPTGDLDPETTETVLRLFADIHASGTAVIVVTHERQIPEAATAHYVMDAGKLTKRPA